MDKQLAAQLDPDWGVNLIIGGHSHSYMRQPAVVNGIPIVQAGTGTRIIGQFDLQYDREKKELVDLRWHCVPINEKTAPKDEVMEELLDSYRTETDKKYKRVVCHWARKLTHPGREQETEMGNLYADAIQTDSSFDIMMVGSGSIRKKELGPVLEYQDMVENTPFDDAIWMFEVTGAQFRRIVKHLMRDDAWKGETEFYQFSRGVRILYNRTTKELLELKFHGEDVTDDMRLKLALQNYHFKNFDDFMGVPLEEVRQNMRPRVVATSFNNIMEEYTTAAGKRSRSSRFLCDTDPYLPPLAMPLGKIMIAVFDVQLRSQCAKLVHPLLCVPNTDDRLRLGDESVPDLFCRLMVDLCFR